MDLRTRRRRRREAVEDCIMRFINLYASPHTITAIKSWKMRQERHVAHMAKTKNA
jgi:hypothetical protein